jgi:flagellar basal-body rod protein FlgC
MSVERTRVEVATLNLANANTIRTSEEAGYQPLRVVARSMPASMVLHGSFGSQVDEGLASGAYALPGLSIEPSGASPRMVHDPNNPFANEKGFVTYPGVDTATEMVEMISAMRAYEANVVAMNTTKTMALKSLEIGGGA